jgi:response regulator RpfG family c-di-GMP phosphodiesterase
MKVEPESVLTDRRIRKSSERVREIEQDLQRVREVMKSAAMQAGEIREFIDQGMVQRASQYAAALQRRLDVERASGPRV